MGQLSRSSQRLSEITSRAGLATLALTIVASALLIGAQHSETLAGVAMGAGIAAAATWAFASPMRARQPATMLLALALVLIAFTTFQLVPLPAAVVRHLSPGAARVWTNALSPLGEAGPASFPLTLDPRATAVAISRGLTYLLAFLASVRLSARRSVAAWLLVVVASSALLVALAAVAHPAFGVHKVFGVYTPNFGVAERHVSPFLNPNHLAEYINVGLCCALGLAFSEERPIPRVVSASIALVLAAVQLWVASRGGVAAMVVGVALLLWLSRTARSEVSGRFLVPIAICIMAAIVVGLADSEARTELIDADASKLGLLRSTLGMSRDFALFGCGRGSFESVFAAYRAGRGYWVFTHPENLVAQWLDEWGWIVGGAGLAALAVALRPRVFVARASVARGAWVALVVTAIHNLVDFGSEIPGIMIALAVCAGVVVGGTASSSSDSRRRSWSMRPRAVAILSAGAGAVAMTIALSVIGGELRDDRVMASDLAKDRAVPDVAYRERMRAALLRHPAEPYIPYAGAVRASLIRDEPMMPWAERTLTLSPVHGPLHFVLARWLAPRSPSQARLEFRLAVDQAPTLRNAAIAEGARLVGGYGDALELVGPGDVDSLEQLAEALRPRLPATSTQLGRRLLDLEPQSAAAHTPFVEAAVTDLETHDGAAPWCDADLAQCSATALQGASQLVGLDPRALPPRVLKARARLSTDGDRTAIDQLTTACDEVDKRIACLEQVVLLSLRAKDNVRAANAMMRIQRGGCATETECVAADRFLGDTEASRGNLASALGHYKRALERKPDDDTLLAECASLASRAGLHAEAKEDYETLAKRQPEKAAWRDAVERESRDALKEAVAQPPP